MPNLDHPDVKDDREAFERHLSELGRDVVIAMMGRGGFPTTSEVVVLEWLKANPAKGRA